MNLAVLALYRFLHSVNRDSAAAFHANLNAIYVNVVGIGSNFSPSIVR